MNYKLYMLSAALGLSAAGWVWAQNQPETWTIAIYLHADHNLDESAIADLEEMQKVGSDKGYNIVFQLDRNDEEADSGVVRGRVLKGDVDIVEELDELDSDDPQNLQDFANWAFKKYPAQHYGVIMWDHGGQWEGGFGGDENVPKPDDAYGSMSSSDMTRALQAAMSKNKIAKLDFLAFDTCLMGGIELLGEFAALTKVYIANPELDYGDGWNYGDTLALLKKTPNMSITDFAKAEVNSWRKQHSEGVADVMYGVHVAYDMGKYPALQKAFGDFSKDVQTAFKDNRYQTALWQARGQSLEYDYAPEETSPGATRPYADVGMFAKNLAANSTYPALKQSASVFSKALDEMIISKTLGKERQKVSGLSVWYPTGQETLPEKETLKAYADLNINKNSAWQPFITSWTTAVAADKTAPVIDAPEIVKQNKDGVTLSYSVKGKDVYSLYGQVSKHLGKGKYLIYGDEFFERGEEGDYEFSWDYGAWMLGDGNNDVYISAYYNNPGDPTFEVSAQYTNPKGKKFDVVLVVSNEGEVVAVLDDSGNAPTAIEVKAGGKLQIYQSQYDENTDKYSDVLDKTVLTIPKGKIEQLTAGRYEVPKGKYEILLGATDYAGNDGAEFVDVEYK